MNIREIKTPTISSFIMKSRAQADKHYDLADYGKHTHKNQKMIDAHLKKADKRDKGMRKAIAYLNTKKDRNFHTLKLGESTMSNQGKKSNIKHSGEYAKHLRKVGKKLFHKKNQAAEKKIEDMKEDRIRNYHRIIGNNAITNSVKLSRKDIPPVPVPKEWEKRLQHILDKDEERKARNRKKYPDMTKHLNNEVEYPNDESISERSEIQRKDALSNKHAQLAQDAEQNQDWEAAKRHWKNAGLSSIKPDTVRKTNLNLALQKRGSSVVSGQKRSILARLHGTRFVNKEETDLQELGTEHYQKYLKMAMKMRQAVKSLDKDYPVFKKYGKHSQEKTERGMQHAWGKLMDRAKTRIPEETNLQELNTDTLLSYIKKATVDAIGRGFGAGVKGHASPSHKERKRLIGVLRAANKIKERTT